MSFNIALRIAPQQERFSMSMKPSLRRSPKGDPAR
jgi:hypothetical protein